MRNRTIDASKNKILFCFRFDVARLSGRVSDQTTRLDRHTPDGRVGVLGVWGGGVLLVKFKLASLEVGGGRSGLKVAALAQGKGAVTGEVHGQDAREIAHPTGVFSATTNISCSNLNRKRFSSEEI